MEVWRSGGLGNLGTEDVQNKMCDSIYYRRLVFMYVGRKYLWMVLDGE